MKNSNYRNRPFFALGSLKRQLLSGALALASIAVISRPLSAAISLREVVNSAVEHASGVQIEKQRLLEAQGDVLEKRSLFDTGIDLTLGYSSNASANNGSSLKTLTPSLSSTTLLPFGLSVSPKVSVSGSSSRDFPSNSATSAGLTLSLPLMAGLGDNESRMALTASQKQYTAQSFTVQFALSKVTFSAAEAYWDYVLSYQTLKLEHQLTLLAKESLRAVKALAGAGEVARVSVDQAEAYLQQAEAEEVAAVQSLQERWSTLLLAMGSAVDGREKPEEPCDFFPLPDEGVAALSNVRVMQAQALASRADLQAFRQECNAASDRLLGSNNSMKPKIDLDLWVGYDGSHGGSGVNDYLASLSSNIPGANVSLTLRYTFNAGGSRAQGAYVRSRAGYETALISRQELEKTIESNVADAVNSVKNNAAIWQLRMKSASTYRLLNASELKKYRMGMSDLYKLQSVSTYLANAERQLLMAEKSYASSLLTLRYQTATLIQKQNDLFSINDRDLLSVPVITNASDKS